jgi:hypothetical protein
VSRPRSLICYTPSAAAPWPYFVMATHRHGRRAKGGHGLPKVSLGPAMPNLSTPCERATPETARGQVACGRLLPPWTIHAVRLFPESNYSIVFLIPKFQTSPATVHLVSHERRMDVLHGREGSCCYELINFHPLFFCLVWQDQHLQFR